MSEQRKPKLHELLAVERDKKITTLQILEETNDTFSKKHTLFSGFSKTYESKTDNDEAFDGEFSEVVTTVHEKLNYFTGFMSNLFDIIIQKEKTNISAKADVVIDVDGKAITIAENVPVSALVQFENLLETVRNKIYNYLPTLDPKKSWDNDANKGAGYYKSKELRRRKTRKELSFVVPVAATPQHPAIVKDVTKDVYTGDWVEVHFSGMITPKEKSELLGRLGVIIEAITKARARANDIELDISHIGEKIFKFINTGK